MKQSQDLMKKIHYRRVVYTCGFLKSLVTSVLGFAILLIFQNLITALHVPLSPVTQMIYGLCIVMICISLILIFDSQKEKTKEAELDLIFEEFLKCQEIQNDSDK